MATHDLLTGGIMEKGKIEFTDPTFLVVGPDSFDCPLCRRGAPCAENERIERDKFTEQLTTLKQSILDGETDAAVEWLDAAIKKLAC